MICEECVEGDISLQPSVRIMQLGIAVLKFWVLISCSSAPQATSPTKILLSSTPPLSNDVQDSLRYTLERRSSLASYIHSTIEMFTRNRSLLQICGAVRFSIVPDYLSMLPRFELSFPCDLLLTSSMLFDQNAKVVCLTKPTNTRSSALWPLVIRRVFGIPPSIPLDLTQLPSARSHRLRFSSVPKHRQRHINTLRSGTIHSMTHNKYLEGKDFVFVTTSPRNTRERCRSSNTDEFQEGLSTLAKEMLATHNTCRRNHRRIIPRKAYIEQSRPYNLRQTNAVVAVSLTLTREYAISKSTWHFGINLPLTTMLRSRRAFLIQLARSSHDRQYRNFAYFESSVSLMPRPLHTSSFLGLIIVFVCQSYCYVVTYFLSAMPSLARLELKKTTLDRERERVQNNLIDDPSWIAGKDGDNAHQARMRRAKFNYKLRIKRSRLSTSSTLTNSLGQAENRPFRTSIPFRKPSALITLPKSSRQVDTDLPTPIMKIARPSELIQEQMLEMNRSGPERVNEHRDFSHFLGQPSTNIETPIPALGVSAFTVSMAALAMPSMPSHCSPKNKINEEAGGPAVPPIPLIFGKRRLKAIGRLNTTDIKTAGVFGSLYSADVPILGTRSVLRINLHSHGVFAFIEPPVYSSMLELVPSFFCISRHANITAYGISRQKFASCNSLPYSDRGFIDKLHSDHVLRNVVTRRALQRAFNRGLLIINLLVRNQHYFTPMSIHAKRYTTPRSMSVTKYRRDDTRLSHIYGTASGVNHRRRKHAKARCMHGYWNFITPLDRGAIGGLVAGEQFSKRHLLDRRGHTDGNKKGSWGSNLNTKFHQEEFQSIHRKLCQRRTLQMQHSYTIQPNNSEKDSKYAIKFNLQKLSMLKNGSNGNGGRISRPQERLQSHPRFPTRREKN
ncbi:uncharacterized protein BDR25DRAFT_394661 [Lindgomyces ingoldianus]|uniref:Uncharacterized protein n=1 Tax=Lindgomyces ingoldianus TaxID=673940 RepID=A0ACB6QPL7_9PLEO|nr:uncharacterized protein BDR25DRAFT_394661 [Lindgomyces ingoldianus]KAF2468866.1 hypothetical protein BDR25DRAFT_394661 [Lindgomyces ingoldianus]